MTQIISAKPPCSWRGVSDELPLWDSLALTSLS
jgi:hypothetical protein